MQARTKFYLYSRYIHGWLSAACFLMLMFFAMTGFLLNHNQWFSSKSKPEIQQLQLPSHLVDYADRHENPTQALLDYVRSQTPVQGRLGKTEYRQDQWLIQLNNPSARSEIKVDLKTGQAQVKVMKHNAINVLKNLHKGKGAGPFWSLLIDFTAILIFILSLIGYILFFSMKGRLRTALIVSGLSLITIIGLAYTAI